MSMYLFVEVSAKLKSTFELQKLFMRVFTRQTSFNVWKVEMFRSQKLFNISVSNRDFLRLEKDRDM